MNAFTHVHLSMVIKKAIEDRLAVKLDTFSLIKGSLKPDFSLLLVKVPHYRISDSELVKKEIGKLIKYTTDKYTTSINDFSERLGVVIHYLSDFFCYAHSPRFKGNIVNHFIYERKLSRYCKTVRAKLGDLVGDILFEGIAPDYQSICMELDRFHTKYSLKKPSCATDLAYTLKVGIIMAVSLISACLSVEADKIAA